MKLPEPSAVVLPPNLFPPIARDDLPVLPIPPASFPKRLGSHELDFFDVYESPVQPMMDELMRRVTAEDARMRRLLPAPPAGYYWRGEAQSSHKLDFAHDRGDVTVRLVYRLRKVGE